MVITDYIYVITQENWDSISWHGMRNKLFKEINDSKFCSKEKLDNKKKIDEKSLFVGRIEYHMGIRTFNQLYVLNIQVSANYPPPPPNQTPSYLDPI